MRISSVQSDLYSYQFYLIIDVIWRNASKIKTSILLVAAVLHLVALSGCQTTSAEPDTPPPEEQPAPPPDPIPRDMLFRMLDAADAAIERDHLTSPRDGSAYGIYLEILKLDPEQEDARRGVEHIVEQYIVLAMQALERRQFATARSMLARARLITPDHPSIEPSAEQIRLIQEADRITVRLDSSDLADETEAVKAALRDLGRNSNGKSCRFVISASNDGQGRWIYQRLSEQVNGARLRAQIKIKTPASVERLCFEA